MSGTRSTQVPAHVVLFPGLREFVSLHDERRLDVPGTSFPAAEYRSYAEQGMPFLAGVLEYRHLELVDRPTGHWPMWSRPSDLADIISQAATAKA